MSDETKACGAEFTERVIAPVPQAIEPDTTVVSAAAGRFACVASTDGRQRVVVDGEEGPEYAFVWGLTWSADGQRFGYAAEKEDAECVVLDGVEGVQYESVGAWSDVFDVGPSVSPDGVHTVYRASVDGVAFVVFDGVVGPHFEEITSPRILWSRRGNRWAYSARLGENDFAVAGGPDGHAPQLPSPYSIVHLSGDVWSENGRRFVYVAERANRQFAVIDGIEQAEYDEVSAASVKISLDGSRVAYAARRGRVWCLVVDGEELAKTAWPVLAYLSPDGRHLAWAERRDDRERVVADGEPHKWYDGIGGIRFCPDGKVVYPARDLDDAVIVVGGETVARRRQTWVSVVDCTPDGRHIIEYATRRLSRAEFLIIDGTEGPESEWVSSCEFAPGSDTYAYLAGRGGKWSAVVGGAGANVTTSPESLSELCPPNFAWTERNVLRLVGCVDGRFVALEART